METAAIRISRLLWRGIGCIALIPSLVVAQQASPSSDPFALVRAGIDTTMTPAGWRVAHPMDRALVSAPDSELQRGSCPTLIGIASVNGRAVEHRALFDLDLPPRQWHLALDPRDVKDTVGFTDRFCTMTGLQLVIYLGRTQNADHVADSLRGSLQSIRGVASRSVRIGPLDPRRVQVSVGLGASNALGRANIGNDLLFATLDSALHWVQVPIAPSIDRLIGHGVEIGRPARDAAFDAAAQPFFSAFPSLLSQAPATRAAALLAADLIAEIAGPGGVRPDSVMVADSLRRARYARLLGARYAFMENEGTHYVHNLRYQAYQADPHSPAGRAAFLLLLRDGWQWGPARRGMDLQHAVIAEGERALRDHTPDSAVVHLAMAEAYSDIFAFAHGGGGEFVDSTLYAAEAPAARRLAIDHARVAVASLADAGDRSEAWRVGARMIMGRPNRTYFLFVND